MGKEREHGTWPGQNLVSDGHDLFILKTALNLMTKHLDELVDACLTADGKTKEPTAGAISKARGYLTPDCKHAYSQKRS